MRYQWRHAANEHATHQQGEEPAAARRSSKTAWQLVGAGVGTGVGGGVGMDVGAGEGTRVIAVAILEEGGVSDDMINNNETKNVNPSNPIHFLGWKWKLW